jgi:hypothetical protein
LAVRVLAVETVDRAADRESEFTRAPPLFFGGDLFIFFCVLNPAFLHSAKSDCAGL